ncbi:MAG: 50S ribosomal protein L18 [Saprospiraceae bacterium]|nr:50S ribosomal protein L18 [Candidatus Defluviibacterium haderslevense]
MIATKSSKRQKIKYCIRKKISGSESRPRLTVFRSNKSIYCQLIDDAKGHTVLSVSSKSLDLGKMHKIDQAKAVGKAIAEKAISNNISSIVFDRNGYLFHGRIKALAESAREGGLIF